MKKLVLLSFVALAMVSCMVQAPTEPQKQIVKTYEYNEATARNLEPEHTMLLTPLIADLNVSNKKIHHIEKDAFKDIVVDEWVITNIDEFKKIALCCAAQESNADVLVGAMIKVETINERLVITVSGYPATYKSFRNATTKDADLIRASQIFHNNLGVAVVNND